MDHDSRIRQGVSHPLGSGRQQQGTHRCGLTHTPGGDRRLHVLHRIVDGQSGRDAAARRINVHMNGFGAALRLDTQEVRNLFFLYLSEPKEVLLPAKRATGPRPGNSDHRGLVPSGR